MKVRVVQKQPQQQQKKKKPQQQQQQQQQQVKQLQQPQQQQEEAQQPQQEQPKPQPQQSQQQKKKKLQQQPQQSQQQQQQLQQQKIDEHDKDQALSSGTPVVPGEVIGSLSSFMQPILGEGVYLTGDIIRSSLVGLFHTKQIEGDNQKASILIEVTTPNQKPSVVPKQNDVVVGMVTNVNPQVASVKILCVGDIPLGEDFPAVIRQYDVRPTQPDPIEMYKCFRPGDIIKAEALSLGDKSSYYLTTAKNEYGVIFAKSTAGATMTPLSWDTMQCPKTMVTEHRKVAKTE